MRTKENSYQSKYYTNDTIRVKIDNRLHKIASLNAGIGIDTSDKERDKLYNKMSELMAQIKDIDPEYHKEINPTY